MDFLGDAAIFFCTVWFITFALKICTFVFVVNVSVVACRERERELLKLKNNPKKEMPTPYNRLMRDLPYSNMPPCLWGSGARAGRVNDGRDLVRPVEELLEA